MMLLEPIELDIADVSDKHIGHSGWKEGGQTHFSYYHRFRSLH